MPDVPKSASDIARLADWLELSAVEAADGDASAGDLERVLNIQSIGDSSDTLAQVFDEIHRRQAAAVDAYPFESTGTVVALRDAFPSDPAPYLFCLVLSYCGWRKKKRARFDPWLLFERLSCIAARSYVGGKAVLFGTSSREGRGAKNIFKTQVQRLATELSEGEGYKQLPGVRIQDGKLDLVAWKPFPDERGSQILLFGQCAAGANWDGAKLSELQPREGFWDNWLQDAPVSPLIRSYFVPHSVVEVGYWKHHARLGGVFFDRCRVALHAATKPSGAAVQVFKELRKSSREHWGYRLPPL
jgi:hypothetical protein